MSHSSRSGGRKVTPADLPVNPPVYRRATDQPKLADRSDPILIIFTRIGKACYAVAAILMGGIATGAFLVELTTSNIVAGVAIALLTGVLGLVCEIAVKSHGGWHD